MMPLGLGQIFGVMVRDVRSCLPSVRHYSVFPFVPFRDEEIGDVVFRVLRSGSFRWSEILPQLNTIESR